LKFRIVIDFIDLMLCVGRESQISSDFTDFPQILI